MWARFTNLQDKEYFKMIDLQAYLEKKLRDVMSAWNEADIYAVSFCRFVKHMLQ